MLVSSINLVVALPAEAKPIISRFRLERVQPDFGFPCYRRGPVTLVVTGPGKIEAAAGTACLGALGGCLQTSIWINLGIAGHAERPIGEILLASLIRDAGSGWVWHPILPPHRPCSTDHLLTLDRADSDYRYQGMFDMEASGFFPTACRYSRIGLVQVLKVISDNRSVTARGLSGKQVRLLMSEALATLEVLLSSLDPCA